VHFRGEGKRQVRIGYVVETPVWKVSYRLDLDDKESLLQGWASVENTSDSDWKDVELSLVSGRPISFIQDLYTPLYMPRPQALRQPYPPPVRGHPQGHSRGFGSPRTLRPGPTPSLRPRAAGLTQGPCPAAGELALFAPDYMSPRIDAWVEQAMFLSFY
jgi:hypothetical protein